MIEILGFATLLGYLQASIALNRYLPNFHNPAMGVILDF
jgi:hypothetical protein